MRCPACACEQPAGNKFCEDCGTRLGAAPPAAPAAPVADMPPCPQCGAGHDAVDADGFCTRCGHERVAPADDHVEVVLSPRLAGVSDRGNVHPHNEDALALASDPAGDVLVVCDGVSSSQNPAQAAQAAARVACAALLEGARSANGDPEALVAKAIWAAHAAVRAVPYSRTEKDDPPEATIVAALRRGPRITIGWLGDSRAYFVNGTAARQLTEDHSWVNEVVAAGEMTLAEALRAPQAHCITRTLGGPTGPAATGDEPSLLAFDVPDGAGHFVLCTDGLWNYAPEPGQLAGLVRRQAAGADALAVARGLVNFARSTRGHDNITVAVLAL
jgi:serine/threonine protein phosphatase PrpC